MSDTKTESTEVVKRAWNRASLDDILTMCCLDMSIGELVEKRESSATARTYLAATMIFDAVFNANIDLVERIIERIDGTVPEAGSRDEYANLMGDALDDVLDLKHMDQIEIHPSDPVIIALAKITYFISIKEDNGNPMVRKDKNKALEIITKRTGGRKVKPTKPLIESRYEDPDWMKGLPDGQ